MIQKIGFMTNLNLSLNILQKVNISKLTNLIQKNFNPMNHNTFWDTLKKEAHKRGLSEKVSEIAKLHVEASKEFDRVYFVEFSQELIVAGGHF